MKDKTVQQLNIHRLSQEQYDRELAAGRIDENAIYLTPDEGEIFYAQYRQTTASELEAAYQAGKAIFCLYTNFVLPLYARVDSTSFKFQLDEGEEVRVFTCTNTSWSMSVERRFLPIVKSADAGKVLMVNESGVWAATAIPNAEEVAW